MATPEDSLGQQPATPTTAMVEHVAIPTIVGGLTKREEIAKAMAAANRVAMGPEFSASDVAHAAVVDADALLAELAKAGQS